MNYIQVQNSRGVSKIAIVVVIMHLTRALQMTKVCVRLYGLKMIYFITTPSLRIRNENSDDLLRNIVRKLQPSPSRCIKDRILKGRNLKCYHSSTPAVLIPSS